MMIEDDRRKAETEYMATILWSIGRMVGGSEYSMPTYEEFFHPKPKDNRSAQDIVSGLIDKLGKGVTEVGNDGTVPCRSEAGTG